MMVHSEVLRGRFRDSFEHPKPFIPHKKTDVNIKLQDIFHTFKKRTSTTGSDSEYMVSAHRFKSTDYVDNIFEADEEDFKTQTHTVFTDSSIEFGVLKLNP